MEVERVLTVIAAVTIFIIVIIRRTIRIVPRQTALAAERILYFQIIDPVRASHGGSDDPAAMTLLKGGTLSAVAAK